MYKTFLICILNGLKSVQLVPFARFDLHYMHYKTALQQNTEMLLSCSAHTHTLSFSTRAVSSAGMDFDDDDDEVMLNVLRCRLTY